MTVDSFPVAPGVTVVVPTVDRPDMLRRSVASILQQDYPGRIDCLVVFDGTPVALPDLPIGANRSLRGLQNQRRKGLAGNRNTGYLAADTDLIATCDDDDEWLPGKISAQVELLGSRADALLAVTGMVVRRQSRDVPRPAPSGDVSFDDLLCDRHAEIHPSSFLFRRELIDRGELVDEDLPGGYAEDYEWMLRVARSCPIVCVPQPLVIAHWHDSSFFVSRWRTIGHALDYLLRRVPEFSRQPAGLARIEGQLAFARAALGQRREAFALARTALARSRRSRHAYAALLVASGLISADRVLTLARRFGRGI